MSLRNRASTSRTRPASRSARSTVSTGARISFIHPDECMDRGACEPVCPVKSIFTEDEVPEASKPFIELNRQFFVDNPGVKPTTMRS